MNDWTDDDEWIAGDMLRKRENIQTGETASLFNDHGTLYLKGDEEGEWFWMENVPNNMENKC